MSTSSMLHARNNLSARHDIAESPILRRPEVYQAGRRTNRMHAGSAVFKTQSELLCCFLVRSTNGRGRRRSEMGQIKKNAVGANVFRFIPVVSTGRRNTLS